MSGSGGSGDDRFPRERPRGAGRSAIASPSDGDSSGQIPLPSRTGPAAGAAGSSDGQTPGQAWSWVSVPDDPSDALDPLFEELERHWEQGQTSILARLVKRTSKPDDAVALIYHDYCLLSESQPDHEVDPRVYLDRFPEYRERLARVFGLHALLPRDADWEPPAEPDAVEWPEVGDEVGDFRLVQVLGQGTSARVFLARETQLENQPLVLKISRKATLEPRILARVRHPNIVSVQYHGHTRDRALFLVGMPYLGGATFGQILERAFGTGRPPRSGRDWLRALDAASTRLEGDLAATSGQGPTRGLLAGLGWARAQAWNGARLADALDCAHEHGVIHGDLKPSNVLISAEARPLLLDFHLATGLSPGAESLPGGTVAYMPPEALRVFANRAPAAGEPAPEPGPELESLDLPARRAGDLYALGLMLREAMTGESPTSSIPRGQRDPLALAALRSDPAWLRAFLAHPRIPAVARLILARCLHPDWRERHGSASALAADLDAWVADRVPPHAEPPPLPVRLGLAARRHRKLVLASGVLSAGILASSMAWLPYHRGQLERNAHAAVIRLWDGNEVGVFHIRTQGHWSEPFPQEELEASRRILNRFNVGSPGWQQADQVRYLPPRTRADLDLWLLEHLYRYARALDARTEGRNASDRRLAIESLDEAGAWASLEPLVRLRDWIAQPPDDRGPFPGDPPPQSGEARGSAATNYLRGVAAEPDSAERARAWYRAALEQQPDSFWIHYRLATVCDRLAQHDEVVEHLEHCLKQIPGNPDLRAALAKAYLGLGRPELAISECEAALAKSSDNFAARANRMVALARLHPDRDATDELDFFRLVDRSRTDILRVERAILLDSLSTGSRNQTVSTAQASRAEPSGTSLTPASIRGEDPEACALRGFLFESQADYASALREYQKTLEQQPGNLWALARSCLVRVRLAGTGPVDTRTTDDMARLTSSERFAELVAEYPELLECLDQLMSRLARNHSVREADLLALRGLRLAREYAGKGEVALAYYRQALLARWIANDLSGARILNLAGEELAPPVSEGDAETSRSPVRLEEARKKLLVWSAERLERALELGPARVEPLLATEPLFRLGWYSNWLRDDAALEQRQGLRAYPFAP